MAWFLTDHKLVLVCSLGLEDPCSKVLAVCSATVWWKRMWVEEVLLGKDKTKFLCLRRQAWMSKADSSRQHEIY